MKLKPGAVPTIFSFSKPAKRRLSSVQREQENAKRICLEEALIERPQENQPLKHDKEIQANFVQPLSKTKSVRTQYRITDFKPDAVELKESLLVKIPPCKKMKTIGINTDISLDINDDINIKKLSLTCNEETQPQPDYDSDGFDSIDDSDVNSEIRDPNLEPDVEAESQQAKALPEHTTLVVFWSCILPLLQNCMLCHQIAYIKKTFFKGTQLIVDLIWKFFIIC